MSPAAVRERLGEVALLRRLTNTAQALCDAHVAAGQARPRTQQTAGVVPTPGRPPGARPVVPPTCRRGAATGQASRRAHPARRCLTRCLAPAPERSPAARADPQREAANSSDDHTLARAVCDASAQTGCEQRGARGPLQVALTAAAHVAE